MLLSGILTSMATKAWILVTYDMTVCNQAGYEDLVVDNPLNVHVCTKHTDDGLLMVPVSTVIKEQQLIDLRNITK